MYKSICKIFLCFGIVLASCMLTGCDAKKMKLTASKTEITLTNAYEYLPTFYINNSNAAWDDFYYSYECSKIYVCDGKIYSNSSVYEEFTTTLNVTHKKYDDLKISITVIQNIQDRNPPSITFKGGCYAGEWVEFEVDNNIRCVDIIGDYIECFEENRFKIKEDAPSTRFECSFVYSNGTTYTTSLYINEQYEIKTVEDLYLINKDAHGYYKLKNNIVLTEQHRFLINFFYGIIDGCGHTIYGLNYTDTTYATSSEAYYSFITINNGIIRNLTFSDCAIQINQNSTKSYSDVHASIVCALNYGTIDNVLVINSKIECDTDCDLYVGMICGSSYFDKKISQSGVYNCIINTSIYSNNQYIYCGLITGVSSKTEYTNIFSNGNSISTSTKISSDYHYRSAVGGIVGCSSFNKFDKVISHNNTFDVKKTYWYGSLVGEVISSTFNQCFGKKNDVLFGDNQNFKGAQNIMADDIELSSLPEEFQINNWWRKSEYAFKKQNE